MHVKLDCGLASTSEPYVLPEEKSLKTDSMSQLILFCSKNEGRWKYAYNGIIYVVANSTYYAYANYSCIRGNKLQDAITRELMRLSNEFSKEDISSSSPKPEVNAFQYEYASAHPQIETTSGVIVGSSLAEAHAFYSVPYGKAPVGDLRFKPPEAFVSDQNIDASVPNFVNCFEFPLNCTSDDDCDSNYSEDCLVVNIYVPSTVELTSPPSDLLPVMFWMHGGAFFFGGGTEPLYDARLLSNSTNTVIVNVNYRLGPLGFLNYEENGETLDGNQGFFDQQLALKWVQDNIGKFGGNKDMVTLFGNSAGAQSVMLHLMSSTSDPMFKRAIMQSNPAAFYYPTKEEASLKTEALLQAINCTGSAFQCLRETPASELMNAHARVAASPPINFFNVIEPYRPILDEKEFKEQPLDVFKSGKWQKHKEVIIGVMSEELGVLNSIFENIRIGASLFQIITRAIVGPDIAGAVAEKYMSLAPNAGPLYDYTDILAQEVSDMVFVCPSRVLARFMSTTSSNDKMPPPTYFYIDSHPLDGPGCEAITNFCGYAFHGSETFFLFNSAFNTGYNFTENDIAVSKMFSDYWGHFAHSGNPSSDLTIWPNFVSTPMESGTIHPWTNVRIQGPEGFIETDYRKDLCDFWDSLDFYVNMTFPEASSTSQAITTTTAGIISTTTAAITAATSTDVEEMLTTPDGVASFSPSRVLIAALSTVLIVDIYLNL